MKMLRYLCLLTMSFILIACAGQVYRQDATAHASPSASTCPDIRLKDVSHWIYFLDFEPEDEIIQKIADSTYDMIVIEPIFTDRENTDFPITEIVARFHNAPHPKLVIAYIDIGQAEDWRTYWKPDWRIGHPEWIVAEDPDGWEGNYPVAYWYDEWHDIWLGKDGYLQKILDAGFDGIYLDWVEAYSDEHVIAAAERDNVNPREEMIWWVEDMANYCRAINPNFLVIAQNAAELAEHDEYLAIIDAIAQEQTWFDGAADNDPPGDCPLPRTDNDIETEEYVRSLSPKCRQMHDDFPESTLHVSSEEYLKYLTFARNKGKVIFTVDYALEPENVKWVYATSRALGFIPFVSERELRTYFDPVE